MLLYINQMEGESIMRFKKCSCVTTNVLILVILSMFIFTNQAVASKVYKLVEAHTGTKENTTYWAAQEFKQRVEKYSKGRIQVDIHPAGSMGSDKKLLEPALPVSVTI